MTAVIAGCGALGTKVGVRLAAAGRRVIGIRRSTDLLPEAIEGLRIDLHADTPELPEDTDIVIITLTADERTALGYRATYLDGVQRMVDALHRLPADAARVVFVSSTSVYGDANGDWVDETSPAQPRTATAEVLLEAEQQLQSGLPNAVILRLAGLYGPDRGRLVQRVRAGTVALPRQTVYTNRIHIEDAAAAIIHLSTRLRDPDQLYIGADHEPVDRRELLRFIADELGVPRPRVGDEPTDDLGKRCRNNLLVSTGLDFGYPTFREGYRSFLTDRSRPTR